MWDAVSIVVHHHRRRHFRDAAQIFQEVPHPAIAIGVWVLGGILAFLGALCFAELASTYPRSGGEYVYLTRAFGPLTGFLFAWSQLTVTRSGSIAAMAYIFGQSTAALFGFQEAAPFVFAAASVIGLTGVNIVGVRMDANGRLDNRQSPRPRRFGRRFRLGRSDGRRRGCAAALSVAGRAP